jgi:uncharacterized protein
VAGGTEEKLQEDSGMIRLGRIHASLVRTAVAAAGAALVIAACQPRQTQADPQAAANTDPCAATTGFRALVVCRNPQLAGLDAAVREQITAEAASLAPDAELALNAEQDAWLEATRIACAIPTPETAPTPEQVECVSSALRDRAAAMTNAVDQVGPFTFRRAEVVEADAVSASAAAASGLGEDAPAAITRQISYPQLTGDTPAIRRFNEIVRQEPRFGVQDQTSETVNYTIAYAGDELISVRFDILHETLGAMHGAVEVQAVTVNMRTGERLTEADVFRPGSGWENFLTRRAVAALTRELGSDFVPAEPDVRETVTKPPQWLVTEEALVILFPPLSFAGPQVDGGTQASIPWSALRPYLNPQAPRPISAAPATP